MFRLPYTQVRLMCLTFVFRLALQLIPQISSLTPFTTIIPLLSVLALTAMKDAVDDIVRKRKHRSGHVDVMTEVTSRDSIESLKYLLPKHAVVNDQALFQDA